MSIRWRSLVACASLSLATAPAARAADAAPSAPPDAPREAAEGHGPSSARFPSHHFQWAPRSADRVQLGVNFGLLQLALGGFNVAGELRYKRLWMEYSHGQWLTLNDYASLAMTSDERANGLHIRVPYTTGFGVGLTLVDELWLGVELKTHRYEVTAPGGAESHYQTYSVGPVLGYKFFIWRGLHANVYARYWPNVATTLDGDRAVLVGQNGPISHPAHDFGLFVNVSLGWAFDL